MWPSGVGLFNDSDLLTNLVEFQGLKMQFMANQGAVRRYSLHLSARSRKTTILIVRQESGIQLLMILL